MSLMRTNWKAALLAATILVGASPALAEAVFHRGNSGEPQTLDSAHVSVDIEAFVLKDLYEGLTIYSADGKIVPGAAESWTASEDGTVYTFKIRENAKWSDGSPVTADDFVFSAQRVEDPKTAAEYANILYPIKNAEKVNKGEVPVDQLGVKAVDAKTVEYTLERPTPHFPQLMAQMTALPDSKDNVEKFDKDYVKPDNMVSNGAFRLEAHIPNDSLTAVKNENYWDAANVKMDKVIFYPSEDDAANSRRFEAKELDTVYHFSSSEIKRLRDQYKDQVRVTPALSTYYYAFDTRQEPYNDVRVRQALSMAIDRDFLANEIYNGAQLPVYNLVPEGMEGYGKGPVPEWSTMSQIDREDEATELLKEAGYGEGGKPLNIEIRYNTNTDHERVATAVADMWKNTLGAKVSLLNSDVSAHYAYLTEGGKFNVARAGWSADYGDPENFLSLMISTNKSFNYGHYNSPDYDALMKQSYEERDPAKRMELLKKAEELVNKDQPIASLMNYANLWLVSDRIKGWEDNAVNEHLSKYLSVAE